MFKYIANILKQFTSKQRIMALLCILLTVIVLTLGPNFIDRITYDDTELQTKIEVQKTEINQLKLSVTSLSEQIIQNQIECTNRIVIREKEILDKITDLMKYVNDEKLSQRMEMLIIEDSTTQKSKTIYADMRKTNALLYGLNSIKTDLEKSIKKNFIPN